MAWSELSFFWKVWVICNIFLLVSITCIHLYAYLVIDNKKASLVERYGIEMFVDEDGNVYLMEKK